MGLIIAAIVVCCCGLPHLAMELFMVQPLLSTLHKDCQCCLKILQISNDFIFVLIGVLWSKESDETKMERGVSEALLRPLLAAHLLSRSPIHSASIHPFSFHEHLFSFFLPSICQSTAVDLLFEQSFLHPLVLSFQYALPYKLLRSAPLLITFLRSFFPL